MSCSTQSLLAGTITTKTLTIEDPYIFTETVSTTPPTLFSNSQKSRNRFETKPQQQQQSLGTTKTSSGGGAGGGCTTANALKAANKVNSFYVKGRNNVQTTQTTSIATAAAGGATNTTTPAAFAKSATTQTQTYINSPPPPQLQSHQTPPTAVLGVLNTNNIKKYETKTSKLQQQQPHRQQKHAQNLFASQNENIEKKQQQTKLLSTSPPPLFLSHTPSLWQTPLLLESTTTPTTTTTTATNSAILAIKKETAIRLQQNFQTLSPQPPAATALSATGLVTTPITVPKTPTPIAVEATASVATTAPSAAVGATTVNAVTPLNLMLSSSAVPLPPSNFHHTTLAQHLQKLQCLKKPKKASLQIAQISQTTPTIAAAPAATSALKEVENKSAIQQQQQQKQHSANDLNEIPVNVIFRAASNSVTTVSQNLPALACAAQIENSTVKVLTQPLLKTLPPVLACSSNNSHTVKRQNLPALTKQRKIQKCRVSKPTTTPTTTTKITTSTAPAANCSNTTPPTILNNPKKSTNPKKSSAAKKHQANVPLPHAKAQKRFRKTNIFPSMLNERERAALAMVPDISLSTKAVAIVKKPYNEFTRLDAAMSSFADENELPFCVQKHWFTIQHDTQFSAALSREERIGEYKNVLRRQAMQLLATRSLQRLPFNVARKRLVCVDALLRKYRDNNKINSSPSKECEIDLCKNPALPMTTICQQHMAKNSKQSIFVLCGAKKNVKENTQQQQQQQQTICNVPVLNIQKQYAPPLCYQHLSQQHHQQNGKAYVSQLNTSKAAPWTNPTKSTTRKRKISAVNNNIAVQESNNVKVLAGETLQLLGCRTNMKRKNSTTSLESIASNSHSSFGSAVRTTSTTNATVLPAMQTTFAASNMLSPPALAPLSYNTTSTTITQQQKHLSQINEHQNRTFHHGSTVIDPVAEQEINKLVAQFAMAAAAKSAPAISSNNNNHNNNNNNNNNNFNSFNFMNTNSNSNLTSSGIGSSSSLPSTDELLTQDMLSNCENSSAYASSSEDTGLGELSESELMAVSSIADNIDAANAIASGFSNIISGGITTAAGVTVGGGNIGGGGGGGFNDDDVGPDEIPLGDARLLEENDLVNVFGTLPVNLNELFNAVVQQDEREEVERALEIADKHLRTLQQTIGTDTDFLADLLDVNDDMLVDTDDICSKMEIVSSVLPPNESLETAALYLQNADKMLSGNGGSGVVGSCANGNSVTTNHHQLTTANITMPTNCAVNNSTNNAGVMDIRGLLQT